MARIFRIEKGGSASDTPRILTDRNPVPALATSCAAAILAATAMGCATASSADPDAGKPALFGDASVAGRPDAAIQGIRPDAGMPADAAPPPADASPDCVKGPVNLLSNADFELGLAPWVETSGGGYALVVNESEITGVDAASGIFLAWMGGYSPVGGATDVLLQDFVLPSDATPLSLDGMIWVDSAEILGLAFDTLDLELVNVASGASLEVLKSWSNLDKGSGWVPFTVSVAGDYAGQTLRLRMTADVDSSNNSSFLFDTLSLNTTTCQ
ncbi:MAG: hypothetical protein GY811_21650 [Myxococcales bacterium]|nr:hypothetical protein [Myxococcales bacterium]